MWNSFSSTVTLFTDSCKAIHQDSALVNLEFSLWGWKYELEQGHNPQGGCILFWDHPPVWVNTGEAASCSCSALSLWLPLTSNPTARGGRSSWSQLVLYQTLHREMQVAVLLYLLKKKARRSSCGMWVSSWRPGGGFQTHPAFLIHMCGRT